VRVLCGMDRPLPSATGLLHSTERPISRTVAYRRAPSVHPRLRMAFKRSGVRLLFGSNPCVHPALPRDPKPSGRLLRGGRAPGPDPTSASLLSVVLRPPTIWLDASRAGRPPLGGRTPQVGVDQWARQAGAAASRLGQPRRPATRPQRRARSRAPILAWRFMRLRVGTRLYCVVAFAFLRFFRLRVVATTIDGNRGR
jgi:hypothetical protein